MPMIPRRPPKYRTEALKGPLLLFRHIKPWFALISSISYGAMCFFSLCGNNPCKCRHDLPIACLCGSACEGLKMRPESDSPESHSDCQMACCQPTSKPAGSAKLLGMCRCHSNGSPLPIPPGTMTSRCELAAGLDAQGGSFLFERGSLRPGYPIPLLKPPEAA
jgi:hypothetical protein